MYVREILKTRKLVDRLRRETVCGICSEQCQQPFVLRCGHVICRVHLHALATAKNGELIACPYDLRLVISPFHSRTVNYHGTAAGWLLEDIMAVMEQADVELTDVRTLAARIRALLTCEWCGGPMSRVAVTPCGHRVCKHHIADFVRARKRLFTCPACATHFTHRGPALQNDMGAVFTGILVLLSEYVQRPAVAQRAPATTGTVSNARYLDFVYGRAASSPQRDDIEPRDAEVLLGAELLRELNAA